MFQTEKILSTGEEKNSTKWKIFSLLIFKLEMCIYFSSNIVTVSVFLPPFRVPL